MDGLLINTEDLYFTCMNTILEKYNRPPLPSSLKPKLMGVPSPVAASILYAWAGLPISRERFDQEQDQQQQLYYPHCELLPGVVELLSDLKSSEVKIALASSSSRALYDLKLSRPEVRAVFNDFPVPNIILGDNPAIRKGRGKPAPDIFLLALETINSLLSESDKVGPAECLVFEDSVPGVEAVRRAGMQVVWIPHEELAREFKEREGEVLAGRAGLSELGDDWQLGTIGDAWGRCYKSLEEFPYATYGILLKD